MLLEYKKLCSYHSIKINQLSLLYRGLMNLSQCQSHKYQVPKFLRLTFFFEIEKFGIVFYNYYVEGTEIYEDGKLIKFNSKTNQNGN